MYRLLVIERAEHAQWSQVGLLMGQHDRYGAVECHLVVQLVLEDVKVVQTIRLSATEKMM